jgi:hypothetical protein
MLFKEIISVYSASYIKVAWTVRVSVRMKHTENGLADFDKILYCVILP